jgi:hypothetical protein
MTTAAIIGRRVRASTHTSQVVVAREAINLFLSSFQGVLAVEANIVVAIGASLRLGLGGMLFPGMALGTFQGPLGGQHVHRMSVGSRHLPGSSRALAMAALAARAVGGCVRRQRFTGENAERPLPGVLGEAGFVARRAVEIAMGALVNLWTVRYMTRGAKLWIGGHMGMRARAPDAQQDEHCQPSQDPERLAPPNPHDWRPRTGWLGVGGRGVGIGVSQRFLRLLQISEAIGGRAPRT